MLLKQDFFKKFRQSTKNSYSIPITCAKDKVLIEISPGSSIIITAYTRTFKSVNFCWLEILLKFKHNDNKWLVEFAFNSLLNIYGYQEKYPLEKGKGFPWHPCNSTYIN